MKKTFDEKVKEAQAYIESEKLREEGQKVIDEANRMKLQRSWVGKYLDFAGKATKFAGEMVPKTRGQTGKKKDEFAPPGLFG